MAEYLRAECYKVLRRSYTWIALACLLGGAAALVGLWCAANYHGGGVELSGALYTLVMLLSVGLYAPIVTTDIVFSEQYKLGTLKNEVSFGLPRGRIYLGKLCVSILASLAAFVAVVGLYLGLCVLLVPADTTPAGMAQLA